MSSTDSSPAAAAASAAGDPDGTDEAQRRPDPRTQMPTRLVLGAVGIGLMCFGILRILQHPNTSHPIGLAEWLIGSLLVHDVIIAPAVIAIGWLLARVLPDRARGFVQAALITGGLISLIGVLLIWRRGKTGAESLALLQQNYTANLLVLLAIVAVVTAACYLIAVLRSNRANSRPPADQ